MSPSDDTIAVLIAAPVIAALVWAVKHLLTRSSEREKEERVARDRREEAQSSTLRTFADASLKHAEAIATNSAVMSTLAGTIERHTTTMTHAIQGIREDLDVIADRVDDDDTPVARPRLMTGGLRRPQRGQKDE